MQVARYPAIVEAFRNHGGTQIKAYAIGDALYAVRKPSIPDCGDVAADGSTVRLGGRAHTCATPFVLPFHSLEGLPSGAAPASPPAALFATDVACLADAAKFIAARSGLRLFGFDVVQASAAGGAYTIVDVNAFPSYRNLGAPIAGAPASDDVASSLRACLAAACASQ